MLEIVIPGVEKFDDEKQEFVTTDSVDLRLEHSLVSISKWESKWCKSFIATKEKTVEETIDYIKCMTLNKNINDDVYECITNGNILEVTNYINAPMTATTFNDFDDKPNREVITSEIIYYWMVSFNIPMECQRWHLNRLLTLIRVCNIKNSPAKKMSRSEILNRNAALNAARKKQYNTKG